MLKYIFYNFAFVAFCCYSTPTFTVSNPHVHSGSSLPDQRGIPIVTTSPDGYMAIWQNRDSNELVTTTSADGTNWSPLATVGPAIDNTLGWVSGNLMGYVAGGINFEASYIGYQFASFYSQASPKWTSLQGIGGSNKFQVGSYGMFISSSNEFFVAGWSSNVDNDNLYNMYVNVSLDGTKWFSEPLCVGTAMQVCCYPSFPSICTNNGKILYAWLDPSVAGVNVSFSSDRGSTWSVPNQVAEVPFTSELPIDTSVGSWANDRGYLLVYNGSLDKQRVLYALFSEDGIHWSSPSIVAFGLVEQVADLMPAVCGNTCGFVVAWVGGDHNVHVSISEDGINWGSPIDVTQDGSVTSQYLQDVSLSIQDERCILGWRRSSGEAVTCTASLTCQTK